jgi:PAS domain S-box-containing protein
MAATKYGVHSLRFKLALTSTLVEVVMLAILISNSAAIATQALEDQTRYRVQEIIPLLKASLASPLVERDYATLDEILGQVVRKDGIEYLAISDEDQHLVAEVGEKPAAYDQTKSWPGFNNIDSYQHLDVPITLASNTVGKLHLSINTSFLAATIDRLQHEGMLIASGEVIITFVLLALVGVLLTRNLAILANAARTMTGGDLAARVKINTKDEIGATARAFNAMASRLEASYNSLKRSEQRYQTLAEVSPVGIFNTNAEGSCIYVNERYSEIAGFPQEKFFGSGWSDTVHPDDRDQVIREWANCAAVGMPYAGEYRIANAEGKVVWVYAQAVKTESADGGYVGTVTDITRLKEVEQELAQHRDSLEELVRERSTELEAAQERLLRQERLATLGQLTATVSHELRNPLGVISNAVYYLKRKCASDKGQADEKVVQYLDMIKREVGAADHIIADLLTTSRTKEPVVQWVNLDELLEAIVSASVFPEHIQWRYQRQPKPFMMRADPAQLTQVLRNLIGNAVQAINGNGDDKGMICLTASETAGKYQLSLRDNGPGISREDQENIFEPLYTTKAKGNGLGLWISRELIRGHGGELSYLANTGQTTQAVGCEKGAEFLLVLPRGHAEKSV